MDICSGEDIDMSGPKYQGEVKSYLRYLEIEAEYSDQTHQGGGYLTYCVRGLGLKSDIYTSDSDIIRHQQKFSVPSLDDSIWPEMHFGIFLCVCGKDPILTPPHTF